MFLINSPGLLPLQPCFHGPLGALPLFSSTCGSWAFISSFQNHTRPGPGLPCAQEAWGLSPAAPGFPHVSPLRRGSAAGAGLPGAEAAGPPRTRVSFTSSLTKPEKAAHRSPPCEWGSSGKTQAWGWGGQAKGLLTPASALACLSRRAVTPAGDSVLTPHLPLGIFFPRVSRRQEGL